MISKESHYRRGSFGNISYQMSYAISFSAFCLDARYVIKCSEYSLLYSVFLWWCTWSKYRDMMLNFYYLILPQEKSFLWKVLCGRKMFFIIVLNAFRTCVGKYPLINIWGWFLRVNILSTWLLGKSWENLAVYLGENGPIICPFWEKNTKI